MKSVNVTRKTPMVDSVQGVVGFTEIPLSFCCVMFEDPEN